MTELNLAGSILGGFEIIAELGRGGMAVVYQARQANLDRIVALKVLPPALTHDTGYIARFHQEARSAAQLEHPHIVPIYEVGEAAATLDGRSSPLSLHYIAMKYVRGRTLKELVSAEGALSLQRAAALLGQVAEALDYAHRQGVIHRDIKPSNIMVTEEGWVYLTDFGLARGTSSTAAGLTVAGTVMGTPEYMSPEQAQGLPTIGTPTDIYALGVVLYELLTANFPFQADTPMAMLAARLIQAPRPPRDFRGDLPLPVEDVIMRALARRPESRFVTATEMIATLRQAAGITAQSNPARPVTPADGLPAAGTPTIVVATGAPGAAATPLTPPYVLPNAGQAAAPQPRLDPQPALQAQASAQPLPPHMTPPAARSSGGQASGKGFVLRLLVGLGLGMISLSLVVLGLLYWAGSRPEPPVTPTPGPNVTVVPNEATRITALLAEGDTRLAQKGGLEDAIEAYQEALEIQPDNVDALTKLALAHNLNADWPNTETQARALIEATNDQGKNAALAHTLLADALGSLGDNEAALAEAERAIELDDDLALAHGIHSNVLANLAVEQNDKARMEQAMAAVQKTFGSLGDEPELLKALTHNAVGYTYGQQHSFSNDTNALERGKDEFNKAIGLQGQIALFHANLGYFYNDQGSYDLAREKFGTALELDANFAIAHTGIGWSYFYETKYDQATAAFEDAIKIDDSDAAPYFGKGRVLYAQAQAQEKADKKIEQYEQAIEQFAKATERNDKNANFHSWIGETYFFTALAVDNRDQELEAYQKAIEAYRKALALNKRSTFALTGLGWALENSGDNAEAEKLFKQSLEISDSQHEAQNGLGWSLYNQGRYQEAEPHFRRATELDTSYENAFLGLGQTLEQLGRKDEAKQAYEEALKIDPNYQRAKDALANLN